LVRLHSTILTVYYNHRSVITAYYMYAPDLVSWPAV
jgi:hypothetical protein